MYILLDKIMLFTMFTMPANFNPYFKTSEKNMKHMCKIILLLLSLFNIFVIKQLLVNIIRSWYYSFIAI